MPVYTGTCTIHAVADCCKQHCREKRHKHPPPQPKPYSHDKQYGGGSSGAKQHGSAPTKYKTKQMRTNYQGLDDSNRESAATYQDGENAKFEPYNGEDGGNGKGQRASFMHEAPFEDSNMQWQAVQAAPPPPRKKVRKRHAYMGVDAQQA